MVKHTNDHLRGILGISGGPLVMEASELVALDADADRNLLEHAGPCLDAIVISMIIILLWSTNTNSKLNHTYLLYRQILELREPVVHQVPQ